MDGSILQLMRTDEHLAPHCWVLRMKHTQVHPHTLTFGKVNCIHSGQLSWWLDCDNPCGHDDRKGNFVSLTVVLFVVAGQFCIH